MSRDPSMTVVGAWTSLMRAQHRALSRIERALKAQGLPPLCWYDALLELSRVGEGGLRPFELQEEMLLPQYGLSRLLDRIEAAGYLERRPCEEDGRGQVLVITDEGSKLLMRMWPVYGAAINEALGRHLSDDDAAALDGLLRRVAPPPDRSDGL